VSSTLIIAIEFTLVIGVVLGLAVWELLRLRREMKRDAESTAKRTDAREP
jgi:hypothetical protein